MSFLLSKNNLNFSDMTFFLQKLVILLKKIRMFQKGEQ
jgi:hypothetical protein